MESKTVNGRNYYKCPKCLKFCFKRTLYKGGCKKCCKCPDLYLDSMYARLVTRQRAFPEPLGYTREEFRAWAKTNGFRRLYNTHQRTRARVGGRVHYSAPTVDRIETWRGYTLDNIQLVTQSENSIKGCGVALGAKARTMRFFKKIRESLNLTKYEMANHLGMLPPTYYYYEDKAKGCSFEVLTLIRKKLGLSWEELGKYIDDEYGEGTMETITTQRRAKK